MSLARDPYALAGPDTRFASPLNLYFIGQTTNKSQSTKLRHETAKRPM